MNNPEQDHSKGPSLNSRAPAWVDIVLKRKDMIFTFKEGHRIRTLLLGLGRPFELDAEFNVWRRLKIPPPVPGQEELHLNTTVLRIAFSAGACDAEDHAPKPASDDLANDMFEEGDDVDAGQEGTE